MQTDSIFYTCFSQTFPNMLLTNLSIYPITKLEQLNKKGALYEKKDIYFNYTSFY